MVEGAVLGNFEPDRYKTSNQGKSLEAFHVVAAANGAELDAAFERGRILGESQNFTRDLVNEPANLPDASDAGAIAPTRWRPNAASSARCSIRTACGSSAWDRCWASRRAAPSRRR